MGRENLNPNYKFGSSDGFMLTDIDTDESLMLIPCDTAGNFSWTGVTRAPLVRNALQTTSTNNQYSDIERPWISIPQEEWGGGRGNNILTKDTTRYYDGKRSQTAFNSVIYNAPLDYYSTGFRKAVTNCPGSLTWQRVGSTKITAKFTPTESFTCREIYIHLRRRGTPAYPLHVELLDSNSKDPLASHEYTTSEITDTLAEFRKFHTDAVSLTAGEQYTLQVYCYTEDRDNYWQVGINDKKRLYYRIAEAQTGYQSKFFQYKQVMFMIRQKPNGTPKLYINGYLGRATGGGTNTLVKLGADWVTSQWKGARLGLLTGHASANQINVWKQIIGNSDHAITVDSDWNFGTTYPGIDTDFVIVDTPVWTEITGHGLTSAVTDIHVVRDVVYFAQGDWVDARKMRWHNGAFEFQQMTGIKASFLQSVRDSSGMMLYRALNNGTNGKRMVDRARLLDWDSSDTSWNTIVTAVTTQEPVHKETSTTVETHVIEPDVVTERTQENTYTKIQTDPTEKGFTIKETTTETEIGTLEPQETTPGSGDSRPDPVGTETVTSTIYEKTEEGGIPEDAPTAQTAEQVIQNMLVWILTTQDEEIIGVVKKITNPSTPSQDVSLTVTITPTNGSAAVTVLYTDIVGMEPGENNDFVFYLANNTTVTGVITAYGNNQSVSDPTWTIQKLDGTEVTISQSEIAKMAMLEGKYKRSEKHSYLRQAIQPKKTITTTTSTTQIGDTIVTNTDEESHETKVEVGVTSDGLRDTTTTDTTTHTTDSYPAPALNTCIVTEAKDFTSGDFDARQYVITIGDFASENHTGQCVITLQESEDNKAFHNVQSVVATDDGKWYIFAKCQYKYRRFMITAVGTNCSVNSISITTSSIPKFEDPVYLLDNFGKITRLFEYGAESYKSLWIFQEGMVSSINKIEGSATDNYTHDRVNLDELQVTADEWNGSAVGTADVYLMWAWLNGLQRYYNTQIDGKGPDHDEGLPFDRQGRVTNITSYPSNTFISIDGDNGYSCVMQFNQSGWNELYRAPNEGERVHDMAFQPIYGKRPDRLWMSVGDDVVWLAMPSKILYAIQDQNAEYTHESVVVSAWVTAGMADVEKLWESMKIMADYLDGVNCWVEADYQVDEEPEWHPIKDFYTISPSDKEVFSRTKSVNGKKLRYRLRLQSTDMHKTPKINVVVIEAVGRVDIKQSYTFYFRNIKYKRDLNGGFEDVEPLEVQNLLDKWANGLKKLRLNSRWLIYDDKIVYLDAVQTSVLNEVTEGYIAQITLNEL